MTKTVRVTWVLCACYLVLLTHQSHSQSATEPIQKGDRYYLKKNYGDALPFFEQALASDPDNPSINLKAGIACIDQKRYSLAVRYLEKAYLIDPEADADIHYYLGMAYKNNHQYEEARYHFQTLREKNKRLTAFATRKITECIIGDSLMKLPPMANVGLVEGDINTGFSEFAPLIVPGNESLIFSSNRSANAYEIKSRTNFDDVYVSRAQGSGWTEAEKISEHINVKSNEVATSISSDGKTLFLYYESGGGDIFVSTKEDGVWSRPTPLNRFVNHPQYRETAASISADGQRLFFSSNRPGGKGGYDIYVCEKGDNGDWGRPSNLGSSVNTRGDEMSPFIHADGKTLYFSSNGHPSLGDYDLFRTTVENGRWVTPENLGYPINTSGYDGFFVLAPDGKYGYFTSRRKPGQADSDIYRFQFLEKKVLEEPEPDDTEDAVVTVVKGLIRDIADQKTLKATVTLIDHSTKEIISRVEADESGRFRMTVSHAGSYRLTAEREGYLFSSMNMTIDPFEAYQEMDRHILMAKGTVGSTMVLRNVFFDVNESTLKEESRSELENIREILVRNPKWRIRINGHTDNVGQPEANRALSLKRAEAVVAYLIAQGIAGDRLEAQGFGSDRPLVSNDDEEQGRQLNRRTEVEIIETR